MEPFKPEHSKTSAIPLAAGQKVFGRYLLKRLLGRGGMGVVWLSRDEKLDQDVALKFLSETMLHDPTAVERLKKETYHSLRLTHPNIIRIYDFVEDETHAAIAMEYVNGWSLWAMKVDRPNQCFSVEEIEPWVRQLCVALKYAHGEMKIVHRDLKPANLLIDARNQLKISDFGIAQTISAQNEGRLISGTFGYMSPQQAQGNEPSVLDDIYSLGATIYELLTSTGPFHKCETPSQISAATPSSMTDRLIERGFEDLFVPLEWEETVAACLAKDPSKRPQSVEEFLRKLETPVTVSTRVKPSEPEPQPVTIVIPRKFPLTQMVAMAGIIFAVFASALLGWFAQPVAGTIWSSRGKMDFSFLKRLKWESKQLFPAGAIDLRFDPGEGSDQEIRSIAIQPDGKVLLGGPFKTFNGTDHRGIVRLNVDGTIDETFKTGAAGAVHTINIQEDGKIIIGGDFGFVGGERMRSVARLNADGTLDAGFRSDSGGNFEIRSVMALPDGKILAGGHFQKYGGENRSRLVRLNANGSVDKDYKFGVNDVVWAMAMQPDGKVLLGGNFNYGNGAAVRVLRLDVEGKFDPTFKPFDPTFKKHGAGANGFVYAIALQKDGKILIGGKFGRVNGIDIRALARLNADGSFDTSFHPKIGNISVQGIAVQDDGKIIIVGTFTDIEGTLCNRVARLNTDGSLDKTFTPEGGANAHIRAVVIAKDNIYVAGGFSSMNGISRQRVARLYGKPTKAVVQKAKTVSSTNDDWEILFDGKKTDAWRGYNRDSFPSDSWKIVDNTLQTLGVDKAIKCDLITKNEFKNFELELEWRILTAGANSGIFYRVKEGKDAPWHSGPEMQITDEDTSDGRDPARSTGSLYSLIAPENKTVKPLGQFNSIRLVARGNHVEHWLNGTKIVEYEWGSDDLKKLILQKKFKDSPQFMQNMEGHIVLQNYPGEVQFRNIKIRRLPDESE